MPVCSHCGNEYTVGTGPDPDVDVCSECGEPICPHCSANPAGEPPYHHAEAYCAESEEE